MTIAPLVELDEVHKVYPGEPAVTALRGISIVIEQGELVALLGASGSGKTTLLNILGTLERPTSGTYRLLGTEVRDLGDQQLAGLRAHRIGFVFQHFHLLDGLSVLDNVSLGLMYRGVESRLRAEMAREVIDRVGLSHRLKHRPSRLSGGERQRVAIARALVGRPAVIFADEPTGNLDSVTGREILDLFQELHDDGNTIVIATHDQAVAAACPRHVVVHDGLVASDDDLVGRR